MPTAGQPFRCRPRIPRDQGAVSLLLGHYDEEEAAQIVARHGKLPGDVVRYTTAGTLRALGFVVSHTPTKRTATHVSVEFPGTWDDKTDELFEEAFQQGSAAGYSGD